MDYIISLIQNYGYFILLPLAVIEGPILSVIVGFFVFLGVFKVVPAFILLLLGDIVPDIVYYYIGFHGNKTKLIAKYHMSGGVFSRNFKRIEQLWHDHSLKTMILAKMAYGLSTPFLISAGFVKMPFKKFIFYILPIVIIKYGILMVVGYTLGHSYNLATGYIEYVGIFFTLILILFVAGYFMFLNYAKEQIELLEKGKKENLRIAMFADNFYPELSGVGDSVLTTGKELARMKHHIEYFVPYYPKKSYEIADVPKKELELSPNIKINRMFSFPFKSPTMQGMAGVPNFFRGLFSFKKFDIIHSHSFFGPGFDALVFSKIKRIPLIGANHTFMEAFLDYNSVRIKFIDNLILRLVNWYYNKCDFVSAPSKFLYDDMKAKGLKAPATIISNPIDSHFFNPKSEKSFLKKELGFSNFTVLYAGGIYLQKNLEVLLKAFIPFAKKVKDSNLVFVGEGLTRKNLEEQIQKSEVASQIKIIGPFLGDKKHKLYDVFHASDVFVMPSAIETQSMGVLQAMASKMAVIVSTGGALLDIISDSRGLSFDPNNNVQLQEIISKLYYDIDLRHTLSENANLYASKFSTEETAKQWEKIYNDVKIAYHAKIKN